jgi:hypothetical protein
MPQRKKTDDNVEQSELVSRIKEQYFTAQEAFQYLGITRDAFNNYVRRDPKTYGQERLLGRHAYYRKDKIMEIKARTEMFLTPPYQLGDYRKNPSSKLELATENDMPALADLGARALGYALSDNEIRIARLRKNPESYQVLRNQEGVIVGYAAILCLSGETLDQLIHDEVKTSDLTADRVEAFESGRPLHIYILALCVDPNYTHQQKRLYGARLILGLFAFLFELASRGVEIDTITARTWSKGGLRLLRHMNVPQLRSPIPGKNLFSVRVTESGIPLLVRYSETLEEWKSLHT